MKKKMLSVLCLICLVMTIFPISDVSAEIGFSDVQKGDWYYDIVMELAERDAVKGYPDGTFKPDGTISCVEFLTLLVKAINAGDGNYTAAEGEEWYSEIIRAAYDSGIAANEGDIPDLSAPINRAEVAKFIFRAIYGPMGIRLEYDYDDVENGMKDFDTFKDTPYAAFVTDVYASGIMIGDSEGKLNIFSSLTRAEAATIILRIVDPERRKAHSSVSSVKLSPQDAYTPMIEEGPYIGRMKPLEEKYLCYNVLRKAKLYESNGCYWIELNVPELPDGLHWGYDAQVKIKDEYIGTKKYYDMGYALWLDGVTIYKKGQEVRQREFEGYTTSLEKEDPFYLEIFRDWGSYMYSGKGCDRTTAVEKTESGYKILSKIPNLNNQNKKDMEFVDVTISISNYKDEVSYSYTIFSHLPNEIREWKHEGSKVYWYDFDASGMFSL